MRRRNETPVEASVELAAVEWVKARGGFSRKLQWIGRRNAPDRLFSLAGRGPVFVEFKRAGVRPRATQIKEIERMREAGMEAYFAWSMEDFVLIMQRRAS